MAEKRFSTKFFIHVFFFTKSHLLLHTYGYVQGGVKTTHSKIALETQIPPKKNWKTKIRWNHSFFSLPFWQRLTVVLQNRPLERSQGRLFSSHSWSSCWGHTRQHGQSGLGVLIHSVWKSVWQGVPVHSHPKFWAWARPSMSSSSVQRHFIVSSTH